MSLEVVIKQKLFGRKPMPLEVILGEDLYYGNYENDQLSVGEMGEEEILVYNPNRIGRGFSVAWMPEEKKAVTLRLLQPTTTRELQDFYAAVERMAKHWEGSLEVEGQKQSLELFLASYQEMMEFNLKALKDFAGQVLDGTYDTLALYAAMWPMSMGKEEATLFLHNPHLFEEWLHEKQAMNVYHESPDFFMGDAVLWADLFWWIICLWSCPICLPFPWDLLIPTRGNAPNPFAGWSPWASKRKKNLFATWSIPNSSACFPRRRNPSTTAGVSCLPS